MKIVLGLFTPKNAVSAIRRLIHDKFDYGDLSMMASATEMPEYLAGKPEKSAASGAAAGAAIGGTVGALGSLVASTIPGFETMSLAGLMTTAAGSVIGSYLGSLYNVRAASQTKIDIHEALESDQILIIVRADKARAKTARSILANSNGQHIETHTIPAEEFEKQEMPS